jgi:hypothetical protein
MDKPRALRGFFLTNRRIVIMDVDFGAVEGGLTGALVVITTIAKWASEDGRTDRGS